MRIAVFSDTHGAVDGVAAVKAQLGQVDWLLHAGDYLEDARRVAALLGVPAARTKAVLGNCDYRVNGPKEEVIQLAEVRVLLTHGHLYDVKRSYDRIFYRAKELGVRAAIFGHTHVPVSYVEDEVLFFNPGSLSLPRAEGEGSCGLLLIEGGRVHAKHLGPGID